MFLFSGSNPNAKTIVENSPFPDFIYAGSSTVDMLISHNTGKQIPSFMFNFINGVYINANSPNQMAIKSPLWFVAKIMSNENIHADNGYIFINSHYIGKPDPKYAKYLKYTDAIIYSKKYVASLKPQGNKTTIELVLDNPNETVIDMLSGLKSIGGIKVLHTNVENKEGGVVVATMLLDAPLDKLINSGFDIDYVPIKVSVNGWNQIDPYTYAKGYDKIYIEVLPVNKETMEKIILKNTHIQNTKEINSYNGWTVEEGYTSLGKVYICYKELDYGTVCVITNNLNNLNDVVISEPK